MNSLFELVDGFESDLDKLACELGVLEALEQSYKGPDLIREYDYERRALLSVISSIDALIENMALLVDDLHELNKNNVLTPKNS